MRYAGIAYVITSYGMLPGSASIIKPCVVRPVVSFKKHRMIPVIACRIVIISIDDIVHEIIMEDPVAAS